MRKDERRKQIIEILTVYERMAVSDLIDKVDGSPATVRRDLDFLERNGYVERTHGHVRYIPPEVVQVQEYSEEKLAIARAAREFIREGDTFLLDSGMTTLALAQQLKDVHGVTMITNSIPVVNLYSQSPAYSGIQTIMTSGFLRQRESALVGADAVEFIRKIHADKLFLSTTGFRGTEGLTCVTPFQAEIKQAFIDSAKEVILLAESYKFTMDALKVFAPYEKIDYIITDAEIPFRELADHLEKVGVKVIVAS